MIFIKFDIIKVGKSYHIRLTRFYAACNERTLKISFSVRGEITDAATVITATVLPRAGSAFHVMKERIITDNAGVHKVKGVKELIESKGFKLLYLPPYSPELSPVELCRSEVEQFLKKAEARTEEIALSEALNMITENDCEGWFGHCGYVV